MWRSRQRILRYLNVANVYRLLSVINPSHLSVNHELFPVLLAGSLRLPLDILEDIQIRLKCVFLSTDPDLHQPTALILTRDCSAIGLPRLLIWLQRQRRFSGVILAVNVRAMVVADTHLGFGGG